MYFGFLFTQKIISKKISSIDFFSFLLSDILQPFLITFPLLSDKTVPSEGQIDKIGISHHQYF